MTDTPVVVADTRSGDVVLRWHWNVDAAAYPANATLTASQRGVTVGGYLTAVPADWVTAAVAAHRVLVADPDADLAAWVTHRHSGPSNGPLVPAGEV